VGSNNQSDSQNRRTFVDEARRAQLIQCAIDAIDEVGYKRATLTEIATRAGITKGAIFYHFANRDELMNTVFMHVVNAGSEFILAGVRAAETPRDQLRAYVQSFVASLRVDPRAIRVLFVIMRNLADENHGREWSPEDLAMQEAAIAPLQDILRRGQEAGEFGEFDVRSMALMIRGTTEMIPPYLDAYPGLDTEAYGRDLVLFFERACGVKRPRKPQ
jgi:AcrR family transcriptional regulator